MKTITRSSFALIPIIAFVVTITLSNSIARSIDHHRTATIPPAATEPLNGSYHTMLESLNSASTR